MEFHCDHCGMNTHIATLWTYNFRCRICGQPVRVGARGDHHATNHFPIHEHAADWLTSAKQTYDKIEEKVAAFLAKSYHTVEEFFSDDLIWWESEQEFINNPLNAPPEARARFRDWR